MTIQDLNQETLAKTSLILGWPTKSEAKRKARANRVNPFMQKNNQNDLSYAIQYYGDGHLVTFAPTGSGKGVSVIIPNLLHYTGPTIVIDPKGENFAVTARYRKLLGQKILLLDPFRAVPDSTIQPHGIKRGRLNPLDLCLLSGTSIENDAQMIADLFSGSGSMKDGQFWDTSARKFLSGIIALEMETSRREKRQPKFSSVVDLLFADDAVYAISSVIEAQEPSEFVKKNIYGGFLSLPEPTLGGVLATAQTYLSTVISGDLVTFLEDSTVSVKDIQEKEDYTLYIVIPPNKLKSHSFLLRIWVSVLMHAVMERKRLPERRTLFMLDECANLGEMDVLRKAVTLLRGYGLQVWMFFQDLSQMSSLYKGDFDTMINNCGVLQTFGASRLSGASALASVIGDYDSADILELDQSQQILSIAPGRVRVAKLFKYYRDEAFANRFENNPLIRKKVERLRSFLKVSLKTRFS